MRSAIDIGYMAGLLDGEGSLNTVHMHGRRRGTSYQGCRINISAVSNSNPLILARAAEILKSWDVYHVTRQTHARFWTVDIKGRIDNKKKFLAIVFPALHGKREQARLFLEFMANRGAGKRVLLTAADRYLLDQVSVLNRLNYLGSVTTARESQETVKIQSELGSDAERSAEMTGPTLVKTA